MTTLSITSWNINSIRIRQNMIQDFIMKNQPDFLCFQEIKCQKSEFPYSFFAEQGYQHQHVSGQKGLHGVAILSKKPFKAESGLKICPRGEARHIHIKTEKFDLYNFYVPAGGDLPDPEKNEKFAHKLAFIKGMTDYFKDRKQKHTIILGDFNIAPAEHDVWSHRQLLKVVSHTPVEVEHLKNLEQSGNFIDIARQIFPQPQKLYTWWSYRARDWRKSNRGRRLDHIWLTKDLIKRVAELKSEDFQIHTEYRDFEKPSDHVPITLNLTI